MNVFKIKCDDDDDDDDDDDYCSIVENRTSETLCNRNAIIPFNSYKAFIENIVIKL